MDKLTDAFAIIDRLTQDPDDDNLWCKMHALETFITAIMARRNADRLANDLSHCPGRWESIALPERHPRALRAVASSSLGLHHSHHLQQADSRLDIA